MSTNDPRALKMLSPRRLATELDVSPRTIHRAVKRGDLAGVRLGEHGGIRISRDAVSEWLRPTRKDAA